MDAKFLSPVLNVTNIAQSFTWFEAFGWKKGFEWGDPVGFGSVVSGECQIFLCQGAQGGNGKGENTSTFGSDDGESGDQGVWMSIFIDNVDEVYKICVEKDLDITWPPTDMPWGVREMHVRHPDGHVFRVGTSIQGD